MSAVARSILCLMSFAVFSGSVSAEQFDLQLEYLVIGFVDSPELLPTVTRRKRYMGEEHSHWAVRMPDQAKIDWVNRIRHDVPLQLTLNWSRKLSVGDRVSYSGAFGGYLLAISVTLSPPESGKYPIELGFDCKLDHPGEEPHDVTKLKREQLLLVPGKPQIFNRNFDNLEVDEAGNVSTNLRLKYWLVTLVPVKSE